jgi:hypothetical protein
MNNVLRIFSALVAVLSIAMLNTGCKSSSTGPGTGGGGGTTYGSGTVTSTSPTQGDLSFTGQGVWPPGAGPSVIAIYDTVQDGLQILGYQRVSGANYSFILAQFLTPGGVSAQSYPIGETAQVIVATNIDTNMVDSLGFISFSGSITVTSVSGTTVEGTFSITAIRQSDQTTASFTGTFNVTYVRGLAVINEGGGGGSGSMSYNSNQGNFSASGPFNPNQTSGTMVGAWRWQEGGYDMLEIDGYDITSASSARLAALVFLTQGTLSTGSHAFPSAAYFVYFPEYPDTSNAYILSSGTANLSSLTQSTAMGSFSGTGTHSSGSPTINVANGSFDVNYVPGGAPTRPTSDAKLELFLRNRVKLQHLHQ